MGDYMGGIGVFDSGMGGLDVAAALSKTLPNERLVYLGDNARVPYGTKSASMVRTYTHEAAHWLLQHNIKALVIACNTASAVVDMTALERELEIPVFGMIEAGVQACAEQIISQGDVDPNIVILATPGTVRSNAYQEALINRFPKLSQLAIACPIFVPLVEMGWENHSLMPQLVEAQLTEGQRKQQPWANLASTKHTIYLLGCTHYPMMRDSIIMGLNRLHQTPFSCVDGAQSVAFLLKSRLGKLALLNQKVGPNRHTAYLTDDPNSTTAVELALRFWRKRGGLGELTIQSAS
jgi:glutamate racemase